MCSKKPSLTDVFFSIIIFGDYFEWIKPSPIWFIEISSLYSSKLFYFLFLTEGKFATCYKLIYVLSFKTSFIDILNWFDWCKFCGWF